MPRLVAGGSGKRKFWHGWVDGTELNVRFGKLGTAGQDQVKSFATKEAADKELAKLVKQKLAKGYADAAWSLSLDESGLRLVEVVDMLPRPEDSSLAREAVSLGAGSWSGGGWYGDQSFALEKKGAAYLAGLIDRSGSKPVWRPFEPAIVAKTFPYAFDSNGARFLVAAGGPAFVIDCKTHVRTTVAPSSDEVVSAALTRDYAALLRGKGSGVRLELYSFTKGAWSLAKTIPCNRQDVLFSFGDGRGLIVGFSPGDEHFDAKTRSWPNTHFVGVDGCVRLLGTFGMAVDYAFERDGRSLFAVNAIGLIEIHRLVEALERVRILEDANALG